MPQPMAWRHMFISGHSGQAIPRSYITFDNLPLHLITNQDIGTSAKWLNLTSTIALLQDRLALNHKS